MREQTERALRARHRVKPPSRDNDDFGVITPEGIKREVGRISNTLSVLVDGIGILNIVPVSVTERPARSAWEKPWARPPSPSSARSSPRP